MTNQEITELAALMLAVDASPNDADLVTQLHKRMDAAVSTNPVEARFINFAYKLLSGKPSLFHRQPGNGAAGALHSRRSWGDRNKK